MTEDGGVLGNLPRSRPGRRSEKRAGGDATPAGSAAKAARPAQAPAPERAPDPVGDAIRTVTGIAGAGARAAGGVAREVLRRLPRP